MQCETEGIFGYPEIPSVFRTYLIFNSCVSSGQSIKKDGCLSNHIIGRFDGLHKVGDGYAVEEVVR